MKKTLVIVFTLITFIDVYSQTANTAADTTYKAYIDLVTKGLEHLKKGECQPCLDKYEEAFKITQFSMLNRLRAVSCAFHCKNEAKWQLYLNAAIEINWQEVEFILKDTDNQYPELTIDKDKDFYTNAFSQIKAIKEKTGYNQTLADELSVILRDDQVLRQQLNSAKTEAEKLDFWKKMHVLDSINLTKVEKIFAEHGYPGKSKVGAFSVTAFLVIQHSDILIQEKYLPLIEKATKEGELGKDNLALLVDRINIRRGRKQIYGSQVGDVYGNGKYEFAPIEDEENVNKRRAEMGLIPIEEYAKYFNIDYKFVKKN
jgi:hypothetical protein